MTEIEELRAKLAQAEEDAGYWDETAHILLHEKEELRAKIAGGEEGVRGNQRVPLLRNNGVYAGRGHCSSRAQLSPRHRPRQTQLV